MSPPHCPKEPWSISLPTTKGMTSAMRNGAHCTRRSQALGSPRKRADFVPPRMYSTNSVDAGEPARPNYARSRRSDQRNRRVVVQKSGGFARPIPQRISRSVCDARECTLDRSSLPKVAHSEHTSPAAQGHPISRLLRPEPDRNTSACSLARTTWRRSGSPRDVREQSWQDPPARNKATAGLSRQYPTIYAVASFCCTGRTTRS